MFFSSSVRCTWGGPCTGCHGPRYTCPSHGPAWWSGLGSWRQVFRSDILDKHPRPIKIDAHEDFIFIRLSVSPFLVTQVTWRGWWRVRLFEWACSPCPAAQTWKGRKTNVQRKKTKERPKSCQVYPEHGPNNMWFFLPTLYFSWTYLYIFSYHMNNETIKKYANIIIWNLLCTISAH